MKTTVEISDSLLKQVRSLAAQEHTTVRALVEEGLRRITAERQRAKPFKLRKVSFRGKAFSLGWPALPGSRFVTQLTKGAERDRG